MTTPTLPTSRIEKRLEVFDGLIDMADYDRRPQQHRQAFLQRALAAYCIKSLAGIDYATAARSLTDSFHDRGIDAIYCDARKPQLIIVQSKWSDQISWKEVGEFVDGVRHLLESKWDAFSNNEKIRKRQAEIKSAMHGSSQLLLVTVHNGGSIGDKAAVKRLEEFRAEIDGGSGLCLADNWYQKHVLQAIEAEAAPAKIDAAMTLANWGELKDPYHAVYGMVQGRAIADLWRGNPHLAHFNIRQYFQRTDVNEAIAKTVAGEPHHFWYFNNGLTLICDDIEPGIYGRLDPKEALFRFRGISLVNGAQTTGIVADQLASLPEEEQNRLWIQFRAIAVKHCPDNFASRITRFTNLQNAVDAQDFVGMHSLHARLSIDFAVDKKRYAFKQGGEPDPVGDEGCTLKEATIALACAESDFWFTVQVKREISVIWDTESELYKKLFPEDLRVSRVWNGVLIMREVDRVIKEEGRSDLDKAEMVAAHLQRIILHLIFLDKRLEGWDIQKDPTTIFPLVQGASRSLFGRLREYCVDKHPNEYLAGVCKNFDKCRSIVASLTANTDDETPQRLFDGV